MRQRMLVLGAASVWVAAFGVFDLLRPDVSFYGTGQMATIATACFLGVRWVLVVGAYAFAWAVALCANGVHFSTLHLLRLGVGLIVVGGSVVLALARERRERALVQMRDIAKVAQEAVLRPIPAEVDGVGVAWRYRSATEGAGVGGDLVDVVPSRWGVRCIVGDVAGHGLPVVGLSALVLGGFREAAISAVDVAEIARRLDRLVAANAGPGGFVTAVIGEFHRDRFRSVTCGHPSALLLEGGVVRSIGGKRALPLGQGADPEIVEDDIAAGRLLIYTDGAEEARSPDGAVFDLGAAVSIAADGPLEGAAAGLLAALDAHVRGVYRDDVALLFLEPVRTPDPVTLGTLSGTRR